MDGEFLHEGHGGIAIHMCLLKVWAHFISADQGKELKRDLNSRYYEYGGMSNSAFCVH